MKVFWSRFPPSAPVWCSHHLLGLMWHFHKSPSAWPGCSPPGPVLLWLRAFKSHVEHNRFISGGCRAKEAPTEPDTNSTIYARSEKSRGPENVFASFFPLFFYSSRCSQIPFHKESAAMCLECVTAARHLSTDTFKQCRKRRRGVWIFVLRINVGYQCDCLTGGMNHR